MNEYFCEIESYFSSKAKISKDINIQLISFDDNNTSLPFWRKQTVSKLMNTIAKIEIDVDEVDEIGIKTLKVLTNYAIKLAALI